MRNTLLFGIFLTFASKVLGFLSNLAISNSLGIEEYGKYGVIMGTIALFAIASQAGIGAASTTLLAAEDARDGDTATLFWCLIGLSTTMATLVCSLFAALSDPLSVYITGDTSLSSDFRIAAMSLAAISVSATIDGAMSAFKLFNTRNILNFTQSVIFLALIATFFGGLGTNFLVLMYGTSFVLPASIGFYRIITTNAHLRRSIDGAKFRCMLRLIAAFIAPLISNSLMVVGTNWFTLTKLARSTNGLVESASFMAASQIRLAILVAPFLVQAIYASLIASTFAKSGYDEVKLVTGLATRVTLLAATGPGVFCGIFAPEILSAFGKDFAHDTTTLEINVAIALLAAVANLMGVILINTGSQVASVIPNIIFSAFVVSACFLPDNLTADHLSLVLLSGTALQIGALLLCGAIRRLSWTSLSGIALMIGLGALAGALPNVLDLGLYMKAAYFFVLLLIASPMLWKTAVLLNQRSQVGGQ